MVTAALDGLAGDGYLEVFDRQNTPDLEQMGNRIANAGAVGTDRERQLMKKHVVGTASQQGTAAPASPGCWGRSWRAS